MARRLYFFIVIFFAAFFSTTVGYGQCLTIPTVTVSTSCFGGNDGQIQLTINAGTIPNAQPPWDIELFFEDSGGGSTALAAYNDVTFTSITFTPGNNSLNLPGADAIGIPANDFVDPGSRYRIEVRSTGGTLFCRNKVSFPIVTQPTEIVATVNTITPACTPGTGAIALDVVGGTGAYTYSWTPSLGNVQDPININAGTYDVTITDAKGCTDVITGIVVPGAPTITLGTNPSVCTGITTANLAYTATTGTPTQFRIDWNAGGPPDVPLTALPASPIPITGIPVGVGTYNGTLFVSNATCESAGSPISVTVTAPPTVSVPATSLCAGSTMTASPTTGGTWISSAPAVATITNAGLITGVSAGTVTFTFTLTATGCSNTTAMVTVIARPTVSVPATSLCVGSTMTATPTTGGTWISSNPARATITNAGLITGVSAGAVTFTFTDTGTGCSNTTPSVNIVARPVVSVPSTNLCIGATMTATPTTGGTWVSSAPAVATITNAGLITGVSAGTVTFTFTRTATGCSNTTPTVTVNTLPTVSVPATSLCVGSTMTATPTTGGTWISSAPAVATISNAGLITGVSAGTATFTFTATATGCSNTTPTVTISAQPTVSVPATSLCIGFTMTATPTTGGTWISSAPGVATITNAGLITGVTAGTATFTFTATATGCSNTTPTVTVNAIPTVSVPATSLCVGSTMTATPTTGGTWISSAPLVATITNAGLITGVSAGSATFTFTATATGCSNTTPTVTVNPQPTVSVPATSLCIGSTMTATPTTGGTWISSAPLVATITNAGLITGISAGTATFTFTATATGCSNTTPTVTVNPLPTVSVPSTSLCVGSTMTATPTTGGTWVSSAPLVATITNAGLITGVAVGTATFTFTATATGCSRTTSTVTVNPQPTVSVPATSLCVGATMTATPTTGGTWVSSAPLVATITNAGLITGVSAGSATFTFTATATGCSNTTPTVTINAQPTVSVPSTALCIGSTMTASPTTGGTWISSAPLVATITNAGLITGVAVGTVTFTFTETTTGCSSTTPTVTVSAQATISVPSTSLCVGSTMTATPTTGGTWISSAPGVATITNAGLITGVSPGTVSFTFTETASGCSNTTPTVTVNALPTVSVPATSLCGGSTMTATPTTGGTWISSAPLVATIDNAGLITGVTAGTVTFTFTETATGCSKTTPTVTVSAQPTISVPSTSLCVGSTMTATPTTGGTWISSAPGVATITNAGLITGVSAGTVTFTFTETTSGCSNTTATVTINALPTVSVPSTSLCIGATMTTSPTTGGTWISSAPAVATITNAGLVTGVTAGTVTFTFTETATGCSKTTPTVTVSPQPTVSVPSTLLCVGSTMIASPTTGGTWVSSAPLVATITNAGLITGVSAGTVTFTFTRTLTGCSNTTASVTVNAQPTVSVPSPTLCAGTTMTASPTTGGTWISNTPAVATITNAGLITGVSAGTVTFTFTETATGCSNTTSSVAVSVINAGLTVTAAASPLCEGGSTNIQVFSSQSGVMYQLRNDAGDIDIGTPVAGTGGTILLPTGALTINTSFNVLASNGTCSIELTDIEAVVVNIAPDPSLTVGSTISPLCSGGISDITVDLSEVGVNYQLRNDAGDINIGSPVAGTGGTINLSTGPLAANTTFNILATSGVCPAVELTMQATVNVTGTINGGLTVTAAASTICEGSSTDIQVFSSENGVTYQLRNDADDSNVGAPVVSAGGTILLPTLALSVTTAFNVLASNGTCSIELTDIETVNVDVAPDPNLTVDVTIDPLCSGGISEVTVDLSEVGVSYQLRNDVGDVNIGSPVAGTGGTINLSTGALAANTTFNVLASSGGVCPDVELTTLASVTVAGAINAGLTVSASANPICTGTSTNVQVQSSVAGVDYQLRDDSDDSVVGTPVTGTGGTIDLPTLNLTTTTTFNVLASNGTCSIELTNKQTITVNAGPDITLAVNASPALICSGTSTSIIVTNSTVGVSYQLRNNAGNALVGTPVAGTGGNINLPTGNLAVNTTFNVFATGSGCSAQLTNTAAVTIRAVGDPACAGGINCFAFTVTTVEQRPSCALQDDGSITFTITGGTPNYIVTLSDGAGFNVALPGSGPNFAFTNLSPADYTYTIEDAAGNVCGLPYSLPVQTNVNAVASGFVNATCFNEPTGQATVTVLSGGASPYFYSLDGGGSWLSFTSPFTITTLLPNSLPYSILVADDPSDPCPAEVSVTIGNANTRIKGIFTVTNASCNGSDGAIDITSTTGGAGGPYSYLIDGVSATEPFANLAGGSHLISMIDNIGCKRDTAITVTFPGFVTYSAPATTIDATCSTKGIIGIFIPGPPGSYEIGFTTDPINQPTNYNPGFYNPATGLVLITKLDAGTYFVWIRTSAAACPTRFENSPGDYEVKIGGPQPISFEVGCRFTDGGLDLNNISASTSDPLFYEIFGNGFQNSGQVTPDAVGHATISGFTTGDYVIWLRQDQSTFGCSVYSDTLSAPAGALDTVAVTKNVSFPDQPTGSMQIKLKGSGAEPYEVWLVETEFNSDTLTAVRNPVIFEANFTSLSPSTYSLFIEDAAGCRKEYDIIIPSDDSIFIPNIFTPNNDGVNEDFYIRNLPSSGNKLSITNRWGKEVFSSGNYTLENLWNGGGIPDGVYYYRLQISGGATYTGWVEIVRGVKP